MISLLNFLIKNVQVRGLYLSVELLYVMGEASEIM